jgi:hypothetical protein
MAIAGVDFYQSTNPVTAQKQIRLAHPSVVDSLVIHSFPDPNDGYKSSLSGWRKADGRSLTGALKVQGAGYAPPPTWQISANVTPTMVNIFTAILRAQKYTSIPVSLVDMFEKIEYIAGQMDEPAWISGYPETGPRGLPTGFAAYNVVLDVDTSYKTSRSNNRFLLQFSALQV